MHAVPTWHDAGFTGQGVKIGIIDYGFEGFRSLMGTELPASVAGALLHRYRCLHIQPRRL